MRPVTIPSCVCGDRYELVTLPANQDRPAYRFRRCLACGSETDHEIERPVEAEALPEMEAA